MAERQTAAARHAHDLAVRDQQVARLQAFADGELSGLRARQEEVRRRVGLKLEQREPIVQQ